jgi:hypothetical protein
MLGAAAGMAARSSGGDDPITTFQPNAVIKTV